MYLKKILIFTILLNINNIFAQNFQWAKIFDSSGLSITNDIDIDTSSEGSIYSTGYFNGYVDFDPDIDTYHFLYCDPQKNGIFISKLDLNGDFEWVIGLANQNYSSYGTSIKVDSNGDIIVTGTFYGTIDFDPSADVYNLTSISSTNIFICKYDPSGNLIWAKQIDSLGGVNSNEIYVKDSEIYLIGNFSETITFDPGGQNLSLNSNGYLDVFFCKYNSNGEFVWGKSIGGGNSDFGNSIFVDNNNDVYITGGFFYNVDFDPSSNNHYLNSINGEDIFIAKYNNLGEYIFAKKLRGDSTTDMGNSIKVDNLGNIFLTGSFTGRVDFDPNSGNNYLTSNGSYDIFIAKYDALLNLVWAKSIGGSDTDSSLSLAINDQTNAIFITGYFGETADFDPGTGSFSLTSNGQYNLFVEKLDMDGNFSWAGSFGGTSWHGNETKGHAIVFKMNKLFFAGKFEETVDFDITSQTYNYSNTSHHENAFICQYEDSTPTSLNSNNNINSLYPNPFNEYFHVKLATPSTITIYNILGEKLISKSSSNDITINMSRYKNGIYIVNIQNQESNFNYKLIKE